MEGKCKHDNWKVFGNEFIGNCTCLDCGEEISICGAFNRLKAKLEAIIKENQNDRKGLQEKPAGQTGR